MGASCCACDDIEEIMPASLVNNAPPKEPIIRSKVIEYVKDWADGSILVEHEIMRIALEDIMFLVNNPDETFGKT